MCATRLVPNNIPTNVVLGLTTTILVTDYSSIAGDFATGRPILYFIPDFAEYDGTRGLYADPETGSI